MNTVPSPNADSASRDAAATASASSSALRTTRMPRPPPPAAALTRAGVGHLGAVGDAAVDDLDHRRRRHAGLDRRTFRRDLVAEQRICSGVGPTQMSPASITACANVGVLGQEAVARMDRVSAGGECRVDDRVAAQVRLGRRGAAERDATSTESTWSALASGSEYTPTVEMPRRWAVRAMRTAISPRFAISNREMFISASTRRTRSRPARRCCAPPTAPSPSRCGCRRGG